MDIEKTKSYYANFTREHVCKCDYCQNLIDEIKGAYPEVSEYLSSLGVNIERPFEVFLPVETEDGYMDYYEVQYLIIGNSEGFQETEIAACQKSPCFVVESRDKFMQIKKQRNKIEETGKQ